MTYFTFLGIFLVIPILILFVALYNRKNSQSVVSIRMGGIMIFLHILLAVTWTTPWDNYLVATRVWWYDPALVNGMTIGYVPIEEYSFFVLQPILTGLWLLFLFPVLYRQFAPNPISDSPFRIRATFIVGLIWMASVGGLLSNIAALTYLGLELVWALPPLMIQLAFGADILYRQWRLVATTILSATLFLSLADWIAIGMGTWTIDPAQSTGILIGGVLPIEEIIFFLLTNTLIVFGVTLALAEESKQRFRLSPVLKRTAWASKSHAS